MSSPSFEQSIAVSALKTMDQDHPSTLEANKDWRSILLDPEAPQIVRECSAAARYALQKHAAEYASYRVKLMRRFANHDSPPSNIHGLIDQLLRFLAMKVLIIGQPVPSSAVFVAWDVLATHHSQAYANMCKAMGNDSAIDIENEYYTHSQDAHSQGPTSPSDIKERYDLTLTSYRVLYNAEPPMEFWPDGARTVTNDDFDDDSVMLSVLSSMTDGGEFAPLYSSLHQSRSYETKTGHQPRINPYDRLCLCLETMAGAPP